jgi:hypothetical protein
MAEPFNQDFTGLQGSLAPKEGPGMQIHSGVEHKGRLRTLSAEAFQRLYFDEGKTLQQIGDVFGVSRVAVLKWVRWNMPPSLKLRGVSHASNYQFNEEFFDSWTPEMAYVLGILATDGCVGKYRVVLTSTDFELVEKVRCLIGSNHEITERPPRGWSRKPQYGLQVSSLKYVRALAALGVVPAKSLVLRFPKMPDECVRHFLRGCWDGDGSFHLESRVRSRQNLIASIVSGSRAFIEGIVQALSQAGIKKLAQWGYRRGRYVRVSDPLTVHISERGKNPAYYIKLAGPSAIAFGKLIYDSVPESMYLKRKYEVFRTALEQDSLSDVIPGLSTSENPSPRTPTT